MNKMTKRGSADNMITYEHFCDTIEDKDKIDPREINLGSVCVVVKGRSGGIEIYIADSNKEWHNIDGDSNTSEQGG